MKYIWEDKDVVCGRYVCKPESDKGPTYDFKPNGWTCKWTFKIGFIGGSSKGTVLVCMSDGMVGQKRTPQEMADYLNQHDMIPMPHERLLKTLEYLKGCYDYK